MAGKKITRADLVESVYQNTSCERKVIQVIVESFIEQLKINLAAANTVELRGFGSFDIRLRKGREKARNPKTGEILSVAPRYTAVFKPGQELKKQLSDIPVDSDI
ncbi:HU family DNA-binding protein [Treponema sp.]|uniref:HU family DNA-binding protein n=1 Tax=Treponema sp. TaxID=166 RepID=UPI001B148E90|nr:HU family DNA-binding protein [Treponema sp.]MBE6354468.1 integration host factor subunit beta [Treponema sp.]MBO6177455.1 integration host factor subunit beta [Treponema sp.]